MDHRTNDKRSVIKKASGYEKEHQRDTDTAEGSDIKGKLCRPGSGKV